MAINFLIGRKLGMTRIFDEFGSDYPVTILEAGPCSVIQIKTVEKEGYSVEIIDARTLVPFDMETLKTSLAKKENQSKYQKKIQPTHNQSLQKSSTKIQ